MPKVDSDATQIAVFAERLKAIKDTVDKTANAVEEIRSARYVTDTQLQATISAQNEAFTKQIADIRSSSKLWSWLSPSLAAVFSSILTFLLIQYIQSVK